MKLKFFKYLIWGLLKIEQAQKSWVEKKIVFVFLQEQRSFVSLRKAFSTQSKDTEDVIEVVRDNSQPSNKLLITQLQLFTLYLKLWGSSFIHRLNLLNFRQRIKDSNCLTSFQMVSYFSLDVLKGNACIIIMKNISIHEHRSGYYP